MQELIFEIENNLLSPETIRLFDKKWYQKYEGSFVHVRLVDVKENANPYLEFIEKFASENKVFKIKAFKVILNSGIMPILKYKWVEERPPFEGRIDFNEKQSGHLSLSNKYSKQNVFEKNYIGDNHLLRWCDRFWFEIPAQTNLNIIFGYE